MSSNSTPKETQHHRAQFVEALLHSRPQASVATVMLQADAIVRFVETGEIVGLSPSDQDRGGLMPTKRARAGVRH